LAKNQVRNLIKETMNRFVDTSEHLKTNSYMYIHRLISLRGILNLENHIKSVIGSIMH